MHELSLAESMVHEVIAYLKKEKITKILAITVAMGKFSGVQKESFEFVFPIVTEGTVLEGCKLNIELQNGVVMCCNCGKNTELDSIFIKCPACASTNVKVTQGKEFLIKCIEVE